MQTLLTMPIWWDDVPLPGVIIQTNKFSGEKFGWLSYENERWVLRWMTTSGAAAITGSEFMISGPMYQTLLK